MTTKPTTTIWRQNDPAYPPRLRTYLGESAPASIAILGVAVNQPAFFHPAGLFEHPSLALFCSAKAPASVLLAIHDLAQRWRQGNVTIISGFHSPVEQEAFTVLLRGPGRIVYCPARSLPQRLQPAWQLALETGRLWIVSPFEDKVRRPTRETAHYRNRFVAALGDEILIAHAQPGSKTEQLARDIVGWGRKLYTVGNSNNNNNLLALGAKPVAI